MSDEERLKERDVFFEEYNPENEIREYEEPIDAEGNVTEE